ncbi:hypothetical protein F3Y22_tig00110556pilonHSYRG00727 [Hibiscus syriacus]|uniref:Uncharacterized protein n=1 Tax=Hibiscus syriacus TaxID=106335 RepID=A0A6A3AC71_HIBSY|nr:hypothetical protein F3Y22_tig00110556pilonHSYRG00727 [Hibiscus syriacus]
MAREGKKTKGKQKIEIKPFSFGHPSIETVANCFLNNYNNRPSPNNARSLVEAQQRENQSVIQNYNEVVNQLEAVKEKAKALAQVEQASGSEGNCWWEAPIDQLNPGELQEVESHYEDLLNQLYIARRKESVTVKEGLAPLNRPFGPLRREVEPENWISFAMNHRPFAVKLSCAVSSLISFAVKMKLTLNEILLTISRPFVVKLNLCCLESNILRCEHDILRRGVEIGSGIGKLFVDNQPSLRFSRPFAVKLSLCCLGSNILRCEVEIGPETRKLLLTTSRPFVVKLNLCCLEFNILRCEVEIGSEIVCRQSAAPSL